jgi:hypothetical protein
MSTDESRYVYEVKSRLKLLYGGLKGSGEANEREGDTEFMRDVRKCLLHFYWVDPKTMRIEVREVAQEAAEQAIDGEVRAMVAKYDGRVVGDEYSARVQGRDVQGDFNILAGLVREWKKPKSKPKSTEQTATKTERIQEALRQMRRLIGEVGRAVEEK